MLFSPLVYLPFRLCFYSLLDNAVRMHDFEILVLRARIEYGLTFDYNLKGDRCR